MLHSIVVGHHSWTTCSGPAAAAIERQWGAKWTNSARRQPWLWCKWGNGGGWALSRHVDHLLPTDRSELCAEQQHMKIFQGLRNHKNKVFNVSKMLKESVDLMLQWRSGKKQSKHNESRSCRFLPAKRSMTMFTKRFWNSMRSSGVQRTYPDGKYIFWQSASPHGQDHLAVLGGILDYPSYSPHLNPLDLSIWSILQAKVQVTPQPIWPPLRSSIAAEWYWLAAEYIRKTCHLFCHSQETVRAKNGASLNKWKVTT
jgi:hypothetical protein